MKNKKHSGNANIINEQELLDMFAYEPEEDKVPPQEDSAPVDETAAETAAEESSEATENSALTEAAAADMPAAETDGDDAPKKKTAAEALDISEDLSALAALNKASEDEKDAPDQPPAETVKSTAPTVEDRADALDRDLDAAMRKKEQSRAEEEEKRRLEREKEQEYLAKAQREKEEAALRKEHRKQLEQAEREKQAAKPTPAVTPVTKVKNNALSINVIRGIAALVIVALAAYGGGLLYTKRINDGYIETMEKDLMGISAAGEKENAEGYAYSRDKLSAEEKRSHALSEFLPDTDKDGLSDHYEINVSETDPANPDTDSDGIPDGAEVYAALDPLTVNDPDEITDIEITAEGARAEIKGKPKNACAVLDKVYNNSISGTPGIVGNVYEFYTASAMQSCTLTIEYSGADLQKEGLSPEQLAMFRFDDKTLSFEKLESTVDPEQFTVSAPINSIGIYAVGAAENISRELDTRIFFLIDNSGSMYPDELCPGSEENDTGFKRVEFANAVIDRLGDSAEYGAAMFTGTYKKLSSVTSDREAVKTQIDSMRTSENLFDGTDIAGALTAAAEELGKSPDHKDYIVLLTDGYPTDSTDEKEAAALAAAENNGITVFTIGLGKRIDSDYLENISETTSGQYYRVSNADALERICGKIESFMSYNKTSVTLPNAQQNTDVYIIADSGFNVDRDSLSYNNFRTEFSEMGMDHGIAELTRRYFTGDLKMKEKGYTTDDGKEIPGYDLSNIEQFADGKPNLVDFRIGFLDEYSGYLDIENKWDYKTSGTGLLKYNDKTADYIMNHHMVSTILPYTVQLPELDRWIEMLQSITFQKLPEFSSYECAVICGNLEGDDKAVFDAFNYMENIYNSADMTDIYDFGYDGEQAYNALRRELTNGDPVIVSAGGAALNGVRLLKESENSNKLILECYDCNNRGTTTYVSLLRTPIYDGEKKAYYQYSATLYGNEVPLQIYVVK